MTTNKDKKEQGRTKPSNDSWSNKKNLDRPIGDDIKSHVTTTNSTGPKRRDNKK